MKIAVCIASRGRPRLLSATLTAFDHLAHKRTMRRELEEAIDISYFVGIDHDDEPTADMLSSSFRDMPVTIRVFDRDVINNGVRYNDLVKLAGAGQDGAAIYLPWTDDHLMLTHRWDAALAQLTTEEDIIGAYNTNEPGGFVQPVLTERWMKACQGKMYPEIFPFWFNDTWIAEVARFVYNAEIPLTRDVACGGNRGKTQWLYNLDWWWGVFHSLRLMRLEEAFHIAQRMGMAGNDLGNFIESRRKWIGLCIKSDLSRRQVFPELQERFGSKEPPPERYLKAEENAKALLRRLEIQPWEGTVCLKNV